MKKAKCALLVLVSCLVLALALCLFLWAFYHVPVKQTTRLCFSSGKVHILHTLHTLAVLSADKGEDNAVGYLMEVSPETDEGTAREFVKSSQWKIQHLEVGTTGPDSIMYSLEFQDGKRYSVLTAYEKTALFGMPTNWEIEWIAGLWAEDPYEEP